MSATTTGRHRAVGRSVTTPIAEIAGYVSQSGITQRAAAVATAGGLLVTTFGSVASEAAPMDEDTSTTTIDAATVADTTGVADATVGADAVAVGTPAAAPRVAVSGKAQIATESIVKDGVATVNVTKSTPASVAAAAYAEQMGSADGVRGGDAASRSSERADLGSAASTGGSVSGSSVAAIAMRYVGVPYVYGGTTPNGFDCSGFTAYVYAQLGKHLPHSSGAQRGAGHAVSYKDAKPGDLISTPGHVAIYLGNGKQIDAPRPGKTIQVRNVWQSNPTFIRVH